MANTKISNLTALTAPADDDVLPIVDTSAGSTKKIELDDLFIGRSVDIGTVGVGQLYVLSSATNVKGIVVNTPATPTVSAQEWQENGTVTCYVDTRIGQIASTGRDYGAGAAGASLYLGRNSHAGETAAGNLRLFDKGNQVYYVWPDDTGVLRIGTVEPISAQDTSGSAVGAQSSHAVAKLLLGSPDLREAFGYVCDAARSALREFTYRSGSYNHEQFPNGLVIDYAPRYGMDRDREYPQGKSLNLPVAIGDLFASVLLLHQRVEQIEKKLGSSGD